MSEKKTYSDLLKDPRWQKKRLEVFNRDNFTCLMCGSGEETLHVHHERYCKNPWDVSSKYLQTLCFRCHEVAEVCKKNNIKYTNVNKKITDKGIHIYIVSYIDNQAQVVSIIHNNCGVFSFDNNCFTESFLLLMLNTL